MDNSKFYSLKTIYNNQGNNVLLSNGISSLNFNGEIPKLHSLTKASEIKVGDVISTGDPSREVKLFLITSLEKRTYTITSVSTEVYFFYYLDDSGVQRQVIFDSPFTDNTLEYYGSYLEDTYLNVIIDDTDNVNVGTDGWYISNAGNVVFSNGFFRGRIEATDGIFSGTVKAGDKNASIEIGKNLFKSEEYQDLDDVRKDILYDTNNSQVLIPAGSEAHGLIIDRDNYLFTYNGQSKNAITQVIANNVDDEVVYQYYAKFTYDTPSFELNNANRIGARSNVLISEVVDTLSSTDLATLNGSYFVVNAPIESISRASSGIATVNVTGHGYSIGDNVEITGFFNEQFVLNGLWKILSTDFGTNSFKVQTTSTDTTEIASTTVLDSCVTKQNTFTVKISDPITDYITSGSGAVSGTSGTTSITITSPTITPVTGMSITGTGIAAGAKITNVSGGSSPYTLTVSSANIATVSGTSSFLLYPKTITSLGAKLKNAAFQDVVNLTGVEIFRKEIRTQKSNVQLTISNAATYGVGKLILLSDFTNASLTDQISGTFEITGIYSTYITVTTNRISVATYTSGMGSIVSNGNQASFRVGSENNYMKYRTYDDTLTVTGTINKINIGRGGGDIATNIIYGVDALKNNTTGTNNVAFGSQSMISNTTGNNNIGIGNYSLFNQTNGTSNIAIGYNSLSNAFVGAWSPTNNIAIGVSALGIGATTASSNIAIGYNAGLFINSGSDNVLIGSYAGEQLTSTSRNIAIGYQALSSATTATGNTAIGDKALQNAYAGSNYNTAVGVNSGQLVTTGDNNSLLGVNSGNNLTTGTNNTMIGNNSGNTTTGSNNIQIGYNVSNVTGGATASNTIVLGNTSITTLRCNTSTISGISDKRDKSEIETILLGLSFINELNPVKFVWNQRDGGRVGIPDSGFIAQEALETQNKYNASWFGLVDDQNPDHYEMSPGKLIPVLTKAIQELSQKNENLEKRIALLEDK